MTLDSPAAESPINSALDERLLGVLGNVEEGPAVRVAGETSALERAFSNGPTFKEWMTEVRRNQLQIFESTFPAESYPGGGTQSLARLMSRRLPGT